jgi:general secretion pathway protein K
VQDPPYLAANRPMSSRSELRSVKGVDRDAYANLAPVVCALPHGTPLNVNTAPAPVLAALGEGLDPVAVERLLENRPDEGYETVDEFLNAVQPTLTPPEKERLKERLSTDSHYFQLRAEVRVGDGRAVLYSILHRQEGGIRVLYRSFSHED